MSDCSKHKTEILGISDMNRLAEMIGDLRYDTMAILLSEIATKLSIDSKADQERNRPKLATSLAYAAEMINTAIGYIDRAWEISEPFMKTKKDGTT